jgi:hypothetical protein
VLQQGKITMKDLTIIGLFLGMLRLPSIALAQSPPVAESLLRAYGVY